MIVAFAMSLYGLLLRQNGRPLLKIKNVYRNVMILKNILSGEIYGKEKV
jgi:hypothetical protein